MIRSRTVHGPGPTTWTVRRRWASRPRWRGRLRFGRRRFETIEERHASLRAEAKRERDSRWWDFLDVPLDFGDDFFAGILIILAVAAFIVFMIFVGWPLLAFLFESLLILPVTFVIGVVARVLFRRPWTIEATTEAWRGEPKRIEWHIAGWRASSEAADRMTAAIRATGGVGDTPPTGLASGPRRRSVA